MNRSIKILLSLIVAGNIAFAANKALKSDSVKKHDEQSEEKHDEHGEEKHDEHGEEKHGEHGEEENGEHHEENSKVGPDKGILKADKELGFILSPEANKNFEIKAIKLVASGPWTVPFNARILSQDEVNLFRMRNGYIKRIDFKLISREGELMKILSDDLMANDEIIVNGIGFVRIAEITAYGGAPEGHSH